MDVYSFASSLHFCLCVYICIVLDLCVWSSVCNCADGCVCQSAISHFFPQNLSQSSVIYFFVYSLPHGAVCSMRTGPKAVVVTAGSPALLCTQ